MRYAIITHKCTSLFASRILKRDGINEGIVPLGQVRKILYPSLRVKFPQGKREVVGDLPPRAFGPVCMKKEIFLLKKAL
jgi:hypothetical protein